MSLAKGIWVIAEHTHGYLEDISLQLVCMGHWLAGKLKDDVHVVVFGSANTELTGRLADYGADKVYFLDSPLLLSYSPELYTEALSELLQGHSANIILCGSTVIGRDLAPRLSARLKSGLVTDCITLETNAEGSLYLTKPTHGGKVHTTLTFSSVGPHLVSIIPGVTEIKKSGPIKSPGVISITPQFTRGEARIKTIDFVKGDPKAIGIEEAEVIVAAGRGVGDIKNFHLIEELANALEASIAGSLPAIDAGWISSERQVGQTGKTVAPRLYIACGISGSAYHTLGMKDSEVIIAINTNRHAPIFKMADVGIIGDISEMVPAITSKLKDIIKSNASVNTDNIADTFSRM